MGGSCVMFLAGVGGTLSSGRGCLFRSEGRMRSRIPGDFSSIRGGCESVRGDGGRGSVRTGGRRSVEGVHYRCMGRLVSRFSCFSGGTRTSALLVRVGRERGRFSSRGDGVSNRNNLGSDVAGVLTRVASLRGRAGGRSVLTSGVGGGLLRVMSFGLRRFRSSRSGKFCGIGSYGAGTVESVARLSANRGGMVTFLCFLRGLSRIGRAPIGGPEVVIFSSPVGSGSSKVRCLVVRRLRALVGGLLRASRFVLLARGGRFCVGIECGRGCGGSGFVEFRSGNAGARVVALIGSRSSFGADCRSL